MSGKLKTRPDHVLEDPGARAVAGLYAQSFLEGARRNDIPDAREELDSFISEVLGAHPDLEEILTSDSVSRDERLGILTRTVSDKCSEYFFNFLKVLTLHGRLGLIREIALVAGEVEEERAGRRRVQVRTAKPLSDAARNRIREELSSRLSFDPVLIERVDESLIGGLIIQIGDTVYDSSLRTRLRQLTSRLTEKTLNEIQSGRDRFSHPEGD